MKTRLLITLLTAACAAWIGPEANGQEPASMLQTNLPGVTTTAGPPEGFDYSTAADPDLAMYGFHSGPTNSPTPRPTQHGTGQWQPRNSAFPLIFGKPADFMGRTRWLLIPAERATTGAVL
jgi:hypothetical protein